jgi:imidazolonepropionase-like amidohydrolase
MNAEVRQTVLENALLFNGLSDTLVQGAHVLIEGDRIREVSDRPLHSTSARRIDLRGQFLMPGLIDAHFHAYGVSPDVSQFEAMPLSLLAHHAGRILRGALMRGYTTVRDAAGADYGLWRAVELGLIEGPRLFFAGKSLSQTGGHGDFRLAERVQLCPCGYSGALSVVVDGDDEVRKATREELRTGAHQIKIHVSGGVLSPSDPLWMPQFTVGEIRAAVEEAASRRTYVMAHAHTADAARRSIDCGVRSIEHATFMDADTASRIAAANAFVVPTLAVSDRLRRCGGALGLKPTMIGKLEEIGRHAMESFELCRSAGVSLGFGTDMLGMMHEDQNFEFTIRRELATPLEILKSATSVNAALLQRSGEIGVIAPGALADVIVLKDSPVQDISVMERASAALSLVMKAGVIYKHQV